MLLDKSYLHVVDPKYPILAYSSSVGEIGMIDESFYRSGDNGAFQGLFPKYEKLSKYSVMFLLSILKKKFEAFRYDTSMTNVMDISFMLPVDINGNPNFAFMEEYMKNIELKQKEKLDLLQNLT